MPEKTTSFTPIKDIPVSRWKALSEKRIFFGHQSVGFNIIDGLKDIMEENLLIKLNIVETTDPAMFKMPIFAHSRVGQNTDPVSKVDDFAKFMERGIGNNVFFAFLKFCYVDITADTDIQYVFTHYKNVLTNLKEKYPKTTFIHVTIPLTSKQSDFKTLVKNMVKRVIGRPVRSYKDNIKRNEFNEMLLKEYGGKEPVFDLAKIESTGPNGRRMSVIEDGKTFYTLLPDYTTDGGHLNEKGRKIVAQSLLVLLVHLIEQK
ncbi:MAG: hypothetical protein AB1480_04510 [Nitrospirota bacterium]